MQEDLQPRESRHRFFHPRLLDYAISAAALFVSAVSLWVGVRTEKANEDLVAASTWPFLQVQISNADPDGQPDLLFEVVNTGVGPAKIESFEVLWNGKPYPGGNALLEQCCGYKPIRPTTPEAKTHTMLMRGTVQGMVLRAGDVETFLHYKLNADNLAQWTALNNARDQMTYRICYCSVLNECWRSSLHSELYLPGQLRPEPVKTCPAPPVPYTN